MKKLYLFLFLMLVVLSLASCHGTLVPKETTNTNTTSTLPSAPASGTQGGTTIGTDDTTILPDGTTTTVPPTTIPNLDVTLDMSKTYNITFWAKNDSNKVQQEIYKNTIERFNKFYPNINVKLEHYYSYPDIYSAVLNNVATNETPNVCIAYPDHVAAYNRGNIVLPLDSYINDPKYGLGGTEILFDSISKDQIVTKFLDEGKLNNTQYLLPFMRSTEALYINKDMVESLGFTIPDIPTWEWAWEVCYKAKEAHPENAFYPFIYKSTDNMMIQMMYQNNFPYCDESAKQYLDNENVFKMLQDIGKLYDDKIFTTFKKVSYPGNHFNVENCVMCIDSTAGATWIGPNCPSKDSSADTSKYNFETVVRMIPQVDVNNPLMISQGPSICVFKKSDPEIELASWIFAQYLLNIDTQLAYCTTEGYSPVTTQAIESDRYKAYLASDDYKVKLDATALLSENIDKTFITPAFDGSANVRDAAGYLIEGMSNTKYRTIEAIKTLYERARKQYRFSDYNL